MFRDPVFLFALAGLVACSAVLSGSLFADTWSDNSGKFQVEADLVRVDGTTVVLRKSDGTEIRVPMTRLSAESQAQAKRLVEAKTPNKSSGTTNAPNYSAGRIASASNLKRIAIAMHNHHDEKGSFPDDIKNNDGTPLLSWRVAILPSLGEADLYQQFKLNEPWDSPANAKLIDRIPKIYVYPKLEVARNTTVYQRPRGEAFLMPPSGPVQMRSVIDGLSLTIMMVDTLSEKAVIWTKPSDLEIDVSHPMSGVLDESRPGFNVLFADGSIQYMAKGMDPGKFQAMLTKAGKELIER